MVSFSPTPFFSVRWVTIRATFVYFSGIGYVSKGPAFGSGRSFFLDESCNDCEDDHDRQGDTSHKPHVIEIPHRLVGIIVYWYSRTGRSLRVRLCEYGKKKVVR